MQHTNPTIAPAMQSAIDRLRSALAHGASMDRDYADEWARMRRASARNNGIAYRSARIAQEAD